MKFFCTLNILNCATCKTIFFSLRSLKSKKRAWQATFKHPRREILLCEGKNFKLYNHEETDSPFSLKGYQIKVSFFFFFFFCFHSKLWPEKLFSRRYLFYLASHSEKRRFESLMKQKETRFPWNAWKDFISCVLKFSTEKLLNTFPIYNIGKLS